MCGILGYYAEADEKYSIVNTIGALSMLQHRGQDAAGIASMQNKHIYMQKGHGLVSNVFKQQQVDSLPGNILIGHLRYPTVGASHAQSEIQPFYVNQPFGMVLAHNGNITNTEQISEILRNQAHRHINSDSDSELLLNLLAHYISLNMQMSKVKDKNQKIKKALFASIAKIMETCNGAFSVVMLIAGVGFVAFRDRFGIRPLVYGNHRKHPKRWLFASESVCLSAFDYNLCGDVPPGSAIFIDMQGKMHQQTLCNSTNNPCLFEYVYMARPDSTIEKALVYDTRINMGAQLALQIKSQINCEEIDSVIPIPDSARPAAMQLAQLLGLPYREGLVKNRYIGRTFIMPNQSKRDQSVKNKLNVIPPEFKDKNILLVDDSIVRGTTARQIIQIAKNAGAKKVYLASASPKVCYPNFYGVAIPTHAELIAYNQNDEQIAQLLGAQAIIYLELDKLKQAICSLAPGITNFEDSCFTGNYIAEQPDQNASSSPNSTQTHSQLDLSIN